MPTLLNLAAFNVLWLVIVSSAYMHQDAFGLVTLLLWVGIHFRYSRCPGSDFRLIVVALLFGALIDTALIQAGLIRYPGYSPVAGFPPLWIYGMWVNFALIVNHALRWLHGRYVLAAATGAVMAPAAYYGGSGLGAAIFTDPSALTLLVLALCWAVLLPGMIALADRSRQPVTQRPAQI